MTAAEKAPDKLAAYRDALPFAEKFGDADPRLFETLVRLAEACQEDDDCDLKKSGYVDRALKIRAQVKPADAHLADLLMDLGSAASSLNQERDAQLTYTDALEIRERLFGKQDQKVAETYAHMAWVNHYQKDDKQARTTMQYALEIREQAGAAATAGYADLVVQSGDLYGAVKDPGHAETEYDRALAIYERTWKSADPKFIDALHHIAGRAGGALSAKYLRRVVDVQKSVYSETSEPYYEALIALGNNLRFSKRPSAAETVFLDALAVRRRLKPDAIRTALVLESIARCGLDRGAYHDAIQAAEQSLKERAIVEKPGAFGSTNLRSLLAEAHARNHSNAKCDAAFAELAQYGVPEFRPIVAHTAVTLSHIYQERGDLPRAAEKLEYAIATFETMSDTSPEVALQMTRLAQMYQSMGRNVDANRMNMAALRLMARNVEKDKDLTKVFIGIFAVLILAPIFGALGGGLIYWQLGKRLDRRLQLLFIPPTPAPPEPAPSIDAIGAATGVDLLLFAPLPIQPPAPVQPSRVEVRAEGSVLFAIRVWNLLLSLLTLGIYSFWGKAKVRRFVCSQSEFLGDRFAFHGTGRELLLGWLRAVPALAIVFLLPNVLPVLWQHRTAFWVAQALAIVAFLVLWPIARVGAYRYRLNRMSWRGVRFSYRGSALRFLAASLAGGSLAILTLGIYAPFLQVRLRRLLFAQTYFGDADFEFTGRAIDLLPAWIFAIPLTLGTFGLGLAWWSALRHRYYWAHTTFKGARFRCTATGMRVLGLWLGNAAIIIGTIGLGMSWAMLRTLRFWTRHIELVGEPELTAVRQDARAASASGESFADFLGFDCGPANMVLDMLAVTLTGGAQGFDIDGRLAARGRVRHLMASEASAHSRSARMLHW
jgi:uncharacterized membrane protein YjgN (DUF898 family)/tetratricopeptide (TPR) repeat protein